jgi:hypothetical protein
VAVVPAVVAATASWATDAEGFAIQAVSGDSGWQ